MSQACRTTTEEDLSFSISRSKESNRSGRWEDGLRRKHMHVHNDSAANHLPISHFDLLLSLLLQKHNGSLEVWPLDPSLLSLHQAPETKSKVEQVLKNVEWPEKFPFSVEDFLRFDESPDDSFYSEPRFVIHIDDPTIRALTKYYSKVFPPSNTPGVCLLDLCSSWVSHFPAGYKQDRIVGLGMNEEELKQNLVLTEYVVQDLINVNPKLPFEDNSCDVITNVVSVSYLTNPIDVFKETQRVLKPGGLAIMSFSNRHFRKKAISIWKSTGDSDHV